MKINEYKGNLQTTHYKLRSYNLIHTHATKIDFMSIQFTNSGLKITLKKVTKGIMFKD